jgi:ferrous iron transport protein B
LQTREETENIAAEAGQRVIALVGNPNVGKSVIFSLLTGKYATVSNYPGTTVEVYRGVFHHDKPFRDVIDTPGVTSLVPRSEDERVARDILLSEDDKAVIQVVDAKNLERSLMLTTQLAEMGFPVVLALNMMDEAESAGIEVDTDLMSELIGVPVVATVATEKRGIPKLIQSIKDVRPARLKVTYDSKIEDAVRRIAELLPAAVDRRAAVAMMLLCDDPPLQDRLQKQFPNVDMAAIERVITETQGHFRRPLSYVINWSRRRTVLGLLKQVVSQETSRIPSLSRLLGNVAQHPLWGIPILILILYLIKLIVGDVGAGICVDFIETTVFGRFINPAATWVVEHLFPWGWLQDLFVGEFGLVTMGLTYAIAIVLPVVGFFFLLFGILEDAGYLPRLAVMANKIFRAMGLSGKAVLPMVLGLGCDTMATLTARILDTKKERFIATLLLALAIPCSAQLGVILGILGAMSGAAFAVYVGVILMQLFVVGFFAGKLLPGERSDFILDVPPFRMPKMGNLIAKTFHRVKWYLKEAVPLFMLGTFILYVLDKTHLLDALERATQPVVNTLLRLPVETTQAFIMGFLRRDYGAAGLNTLFQQGTLDTVQALVSLVVITLFVPCIANVFVIIKEQGLRKAIYILCFIFPYAFIVGAALNLVLRLLHFGG